MVETSHKPMGLVVAAALFIALGVMSLMGVGLLWPMFILVPGLMMLGVAFIGGRAGAAALSIPGMLVTGTGALMFVQNLTGYWESWAYAWTLYGAFLGMGFMLMGQQFEDPSLHRVGQGFVNFSLLLFAGFAVLFELIIGINGYGSRNAMVLIALGLFMLTRTSVCDQIWAALSGSGKAKRQVKSKRDDEQLFTGPIVYGTRVTSRRANRLSLSTDAEDVSDQERHTY